MIVFAATALICALAAGPESTTVIVSDVKPIEGAIVYMTTAIGERVPDGKDRMTDGEGKADFGPLDPKHHVLKVVVEFERRSKIVTIESNGVAFPETVTIKLGSERPRLPTRY